MKRRPGLWVLLSAGVLWLSLQNVDGIRATALIFAKSTTTDAAPASNSSSSSDESSTEGSTEATSNTTKPALTGNPQIDYLLDQNLPRELNGYNLSDYPFYERVPKVPPIDFKCDGLHDGFYASVPHKCQVYHHCLFGQRYDFLCANYTAFDQKTFICHFVSEVDCVNSKKYWFRNDALYEAASTTTAKPSPAPVVIYTPPPPAPGAGGKRRKPLRRRRPQYEYYDDEEEEYEDYYYDERPRATTRRKKPRPKLRPRPRPVYEDDYEEYEEDKYERRSSRKPYNNRRPTTGGKSRRKHKEEEDYEDVTKSTEQRPQKKKPQDDYEDVEERRSKPKKRRPIEDEEDEHPRGKIKQTTEKSMIQPSSGSSLFNRPRAAPKIKPPVPKHEADKYAYRPASKTAQAEDEEYYDDYEEEPPKPQRKHSESRKQISSRVKIEETTTTTTTSTTKKPKASYRNRSTTKKPPPVPDSSDYEYEDDIIKIPSTTRKPATTEKETPAPRPESIVRIVKRPFLPSRGGNPSPRGLQAVGTKAKEVQDEANTSLESAEIKESFRPSPVLIKTPSRQKVETPDEFRPVSDRPQTARQNYKAHRDYAGPRTTQKPKIIEKNPLDIEENEYDVTLNDALNPTLPNLPVRSFPTGFSATNDYTYSSFQRPRYVVEGAASSDYYQTHTPNEQTYHRPRVTQAYYTSL